MNGVSLAGVASLSPSQVADTAWQVEGLGDFNRDGAVDLLWRHQTAGYLSVWLMNGAALAWSALLVPDRVTDVNWKVAGVADFDADGKVDILWQNQSVGYLSVWYMNGTSLVRSASLNPGRVADVNWKILLR